MTNFNRAVYALNITVVQINVYVPTTAISGSTFCAMASSRPPSVRPGP